MVFNLAVATSLGVMHYPFNIPGALERAVDILGDEGFALQLLLSSVGSVAVTGTVVSERGMPEESYSRSDQWPRVVNQAMFIIHYNLYRAELRGKYAGAVRQPAKETLFHYPLNTINRKIVRHYRYAPRAILFMGFSYLTYCARYYLRVLRSLKQIVIDRNSTELARVTARLRERGILRSIVAVPPSGRSRGPLDAVSKDQAEAWRRR